MKVITDQGEAFELGETEATPTISITDFSRRVTDDYGVTTVVERGFSRRLSVKLAVPFDSVSAVQQRLADLRATSALWVANERLEWLSVRGFYKDFDLDHAVPPLSYCTLTIEGLAETTTAADDGSDPAPTGATSTLRLLTPVDITDATFINSSVPENDYPEWSTATNYAVGARVIKASTHRVYESSVSPNLGNDPVGSSGKWLDVGATNRWAMFDQALGSATTAANTILAKVNVAGVNAVALLDVVGDSVRVQAPGYDSTAAVTAGAITFLDLPDVSGRLLVTITGPDQVAVGTLLVGRLLDLGITESSPTAGITDYSRKVVDDFGDVTVVERAWSKRMAAKALIRTDAIDVVANRIAAVRARPSLWIGQRGIDSLTVYGFFKDFSIEVGPHVSKLSLSIEGLSKAAPVAPIAPGGSVAWPDITDPTGEKPANNADVTGDNTSKDTNAVSGMPSDALVAALAAAKLRVDTLENQTIPAVNATVAQASAEIGAARTDLANTRADFDTRIASANGAISAAQTGLDTARGILDAEIARAKGADEDLKQRIDSIAAGGDYDDSSVRALIQTVDTARADGDRAIGQRIDLVQTDYQGRDANVNARVTDAITTLVNTDTALGEQINTVTADYKSRDANVNARVTDAITTLVNTDSALAQQIKTVTTDYQSRDANVNVRIGQEVAALSSADAAIGRRVDGVTAQFNGLNASVNDLTISVADRFNAAAQRVTTLTAQVLDRRANLLPNGSGEFGINTGRLDAWRAGGGNWYSGVSTAWGQRLQVDGTTLNVLSVDSPVIPCGANAWYTASADMLMLSDAPNPYCYVDLVFLRANGENIYGGGRPVAGQRDFGSPGFRDATWVTRQAPADAVSMYMRGVFVREDSGTHRNLGIREAKIEIGQGPYSAYSQEATVQSSAAAIRQEAATRADSDSALGQRIDSVTADYRSRDANVNARVTDAVTSLVNTDAALGQRITNITADYQSRDANVNARIGQEVAALSNADAAIGRRIDVIGSQYNGLSASITDLSTTVANQNAATTQRVTTLSALVLNPGANLLPNTSGENGGVNTGQPYQWTAGGGPWLTGISPTWGARIYNDAPTTNVISLDGPRMGCAPNTSYTASADLLLISDLSDPFCYVDIVFELSDGSLNYAGGGRPVHGIRDFGSPGFRDATWATARAPGNAVKVFMRAIFASNQAGAHRNLGMRQAKLEVGAGPYTAYSQEATVQQSAAQIQTTQAAVADVKGRTAAFWRTVAVAGNNRAQITISADANGGAGVDIVGDVSIAGSLLVDGDITSTKFNASTMAQTGSVSWQGQVDGTAGGADVPFSLILTPIQPRGRFLFEAQMQIVTNAGQTTVTANYQGTGKQLRVRYVADSRGVFLRAPDAQGNIYQVGSAAFQTVAVVATTPFIARFVATVFSGGSDSGVIDRGDYYERIISASYSVLAISLKATWLAI